VSSIKCYRELPLHMKMAKKTNAHKLLPTKWINSLDALALFAFGKGIQKRIELYQKYLSERNPNYLSWAINALIQWDQNYTSEKIIHVHGKNDTVFPIRNLDKPFIKIDGGHAAIITNAKWFNSELPKLLNETKGSAIIYVRSRIATEQIAKVLDNNGISSGYYHGGLDSKIKETVYSNWKSHKFRVMVATNAFGMGIDKSDVGLVIHLSIPGSLEAYFQESGRAGRNGKKAKAVLIMGPNSVEDTRKWFRNQIPEIVFLKLIYKKLCTYFQIAYGEFGRTQMGLKFDEFCQLYKVSKLKTFTALKLLERHGILVFETFYKNKISLQFLVSNKLLQQHIKNQSIKNLIVNTILRTCEGVFERSTVIDVKKIANKTGLKNNQIIQVLEQFKSEEIAAFENRQTDAQITFLVPREDDKTIHAISKSINHQNKIKLDKLKAVLAFAQNNTNCKSVQLLNYFGEKDPIRCKVCNVCDAADARQKHCTQEDIERVYKTLEKRTLTSRELVDICNLEPEKVFFILRHLLENKMINLTATNQYQIL